MSQLQTPMMTMPQLGMPQPPAMSVAPVAPVPPGMPVANVPGLPPIPMSAVVDFDALIRESEELGKADPKVTVHYCIATQKLKDELMERNRKNRFLKKSVHQAYTEAMITNLSDSNGNPIYGLTAWNFTLPVIIFVDADGNMHNGQHCLTAWSDALQILNDHAIAIKTGDKSKIEKPIDYAALGVTLESLRMRLVIVRGIDPDAADFIDIARKRTVGDVLYRNRADKTPDGKGRLFADMDYSSLIKKGKSSIDPKDMDRYQNQESTYLATVLKIVAWRKWYGEFARGGSAGGKKFEAGPATLALQEFPDVPQSVHRVWLMLQDKQFAQLAGKGKKAKAPTGNNPGEAGFPGLQISEPYLMASHYLAAMAFAKEQTEVDEAGKPVSDGKGGFRTIWRATPEGMNYADAFIRLLVNGPQSAEDNLKYQWLQQLRSMLAIDPKDDANFGENGQPVPGLLWFDGSNVGLKQRFNALGHAFNHFCNPAYVVPLAQLKQTKSYYGGGFDQPKEAPATIPQNANQQTATAAS